MAKIVVANWKMNPPSQKEAEILFVKTDELAKRVKKIKVVVCPPFPYLFIFKKYRLKKISLGSQNISKEERGSHTGEVSPEMLVGMGGHYCIVGHSEERSKGETNELVNGKILNLLKSKIMPIVCIGEKIRDKEGNYLSFIEDEIKQCFSGVPGAKMKNIIIAYEPIWAIGAGAPREATVEEFTEIKIFIRKIISDIYGPKIAHNVPILYGGSVNPENANNFVGKGGADGLLVGRDSLDYKKFNGILGAVAKK